MQVKGDFHEAEQLTTRALEIRSRLFGPDHPDTLDSQQELAWFRHDQGRLSDAEKLERDVFERRKRLFGEHHESTLGSRNALANTLARIFHE